MYHYLTGKLAEKTSTGIVLDVGGVGYQIQIPASSYTALPDPGQSVRILTHFVVREDSHTLYGFVTEEERHLFRLLISISGIGPKMAITMLSGMSVPELKRAIIEGLLPVLTEIPGIGRKTAERVVVELREKLVLTERRSGGAPATQKMQAAEQLVEDSLQALIALGYQKKAAKEAIQKVLKNSAVEKNTVEEIIRASLKYV